jgi:phenylalanyl-tRNA synthetase alpha chain
VTGRPEGVPLTPEQLSRLRDLGAGSETQATLFESELARDGFFKSEERRLAAAARAEVRALLASGGRPLAETLAEKLCAALAREGFVQVATPIVMSRARLERMGLAGDPLLASQVFWLDDKRCLRPMLAPHLYEYMLDLARIATGPFRLFEIGPCFRKESKGARHGGEFTMLNLVEVGGTLDGRLARLGELAGLLMSEAGLADWRLETVESSVYGQTVDVLGPGDLELASCSMGPHPLDEAWAFDGTWVGLGLGIERLAMAVSGLDRLGPVGRGFGRLMGRPLRL